MHRRRISAAALAALTLTGLAVATQTFGAGDAKRSLAAQFSDSLPKNTTIRLATGAFDPHNGVPSVASDLRTTRTHYWLVQADYPVTKQVRTAVQSKGGRITAQLPDVTWVVNATLAQANTIRGLGGIRWVGPYQPAYKVSPLLDDLKPDMQLRVWPHKGVTGNAIVPALHTIPGIEVVQTRGALAVVRAPSTAAVHAIARIDDVAWVEHLPTYKLHNSNALWVTDTGERDVLAAAAPGHLNGAGQTAAVADTGVNYIPDPNGKAQKAFSDCDAAGHCKLADYVQPQNGTSVDQMNSVKATGSQHRKMAGYFNLTVDPVARSQEASWHGTHTAGSIAADYPDANGQYGTRNREADGLAAGARLIFQDVESGGGLSGLPADPYDLFNQVYDLNRNGRYDPDEDARTHNNSYGAIYPEFDDGGAARTDDFITDHPDMTVVFSASNDGPDAASLAGGPQESKNVITSCASANGRQPLVAPDAVAVFSSHGPTLDGRLKPDVCTPGQIVVSPKGGTVDDDQYLQGTSMSGPVLVGVATLVRQYYWDGFGPLNGTGFATGTRDFTKRYDPSASLTKATIINSAQRMRGAYSGDDGTHPELNGQWPSAGQGWGKVQLDSALYFPGDDRSLFTVDRASDTAHGLETGTAVTETLDVAPGQPLDITLAWTDPTSALGAGSPVLVNNLDLTVTAPNGTVYRGNDFTTQSPVLGQPGDQNAAVNESRAGGNAPDVKNNVEGVRIANPAVGQWKINVAGTNVLSGPQGYSLVASGRIATDTPRIVTDVAKYQTGKKATGWLLGARLNGDVAGFERVAPGVYRSVQSATGSALTFSGAGATLTVPVDDTMPAVANLNIESVAADLARVTWTTDEKSTGEIVVKGSDGTATSYPDVYNVSGFKGLTTPQVESAGNYLNRKVLGTKHEVNVTGLAPGAAYTYVINNTDEAGNTGAGATGSFTSTDAIYSTNATDQAALVQGDTTTGLPTTDVPVNDPVGLPVKVNQPWGTSTQFYTGAYETTPGGQQPGTRISSVKSMPAFMFRLPASLDPNRISAAAVEMFSAHDVVDPYTDRPVFSMDLLNSSVESAWGPGTTYATVDTASADVHMAADMSLRRGNNVPYTFHVPCNDIANFRKNLATDTGGRRAAFRLRGLTDQQESLFSFEFGFGRRSRGPQLRPRLILFLDGADPMPCTATAAPKVSDVLVDHTDASSAIVSWRTDVPADSTVYVRKQGTTEWTPVSAPVRVTQHFVRVSNLEKGAQYEFVVRSATCNGLVTVDDNGGKAYALFRPPTITGLFAQDSAATSALVGWTTNTAATSIVHWGAAPTKLDQTATTAGNTNSHSVTIPGVNPCQRIYFQAESTDTSGQKVLSPVYSFDKPARSTTAATTFDFESGTQGWTMTPSSGNGNLTAGPSGAVVTASPTIWNRQADNDNAGSQAFRTVIKATGEPGYTSNVNIRLLSPPIALPAGQSTLNWSEAFNVEPDEAGVTNAADDTIVEASADDGGSWVTLRKRSDSSVGAVLTTAERPGQSAGYPALSTASAVIPPEMAGKTIRLGFRFVSDGKTEVPGGGWTVDNIKILNARCPLLVSAAAAPAAPAAPEYAASDQSGVGPLPAPAAGASSIGALPTPDTPSDLAKKSGTCKCGPIRFLPAAGGGGLPVVLPITPPKVLGATGRLPATGGGVLALPALALLGGAGGVSRLRGKRRKVQAAPKS